MPAQMPITERTLRIVGWAPQMWSLQQQLRILVDALERLAHLIGIERQCERRLVDRHAGQCGTVVKLAVAIHVKPATEVEGETELRHGPAPRCSRLNSRLTEGGAPRSRAAPRFFYHACGREDISCAGGFAAGACSIAAEQHTCIPPPVSA